jgi:mRNA-degrading endonuclease RelE of RelBE toxin-antitoxin system
MKVYFTPRADRDYDDLSTRLQRTVDKQLNFLVLNIRHPSLRAKKYDEANDVWQGRVNDDYRFYFRIVEDEYRILRIVPHPK